MPANTTMNTDIFVGTKIYRNYREGIHLLDPIDVKIFRAKLRAFKTSMFRTAFMDLDNKPSNVYWHHKPTATYDLDDEIEKMGEKVKALNTNDKYYEDTKKDLEIRIEKLVTKKDNGEKVFRVHRLNQVVLSYLYEVKMHLITYGDQAYANLGTTLAVIPEAIIGQSINLESLTTIDNPDAEKPEDRSKITMTARKVIDMSRAYHDFENLCWQEWEQLLLDPEHIIEFNTKGRISIDPVLESQIGHFLDAIYDAFYTHELWKEFYKMQGVMEQAEMAREQLHKHFTRGLNETLEYMEAYEEKYSNMVLELAALTRRFNNIYTDTVDKIDYLEESLKDGGILDAIAKTIENMGNEVAEIEKRQEISKLRLEDAKKYNQTANANLERKIKKIEDKFGSEGTKYILDKYIIETQIEEPEELEYEIEEDTNEDTNEDNGKKQNFLQKFLSR